MTTAETESFSPAGRPERIEASLRALAVELKDDAPELLPRLASLLPGGDLDAEAADPPGADSLVPIVDYDRHPYYADFADAGANLRAEARGRFMDGFVAMMQAEQAVARRAARSEPDAGTPPSPALKALQDDGVWRFRLTPSELAETLERSEPAARTLEAKRSQLSPEQRGVKGVLQLLADETRPDADLEFYDGLLRSHAVHETLERYYGCPFRLLSVNLQINSGDDTGIARVCAYPDGRLAPTYYMHIDSAVGVLKILMYRSARVTAETGAFRYLPGAHKALDPVQRAIRKTADKAKFEGLKDETRAMFMALPRAFRRKANFGNDLLEETGADTASLLEREVALEGDAGEGFLADVNGVHRGNIHSDPTGRREMFKFVLKAAK